MHIPVETIIDFHHKRTQCHIDCVNYFAGLLGYHFPEHDNDKNKNPIQIGYAYVNYAKYHCAHLLPAQQDAFRYACQEHHKNNLHHIEHGNKIFKQNIDLHHTTISVLLAVVSCTLQNVFIKMYVEKIFF